MSGRFLLIISGVLLTFAYIIYARFVSGRIKIDDNSATPAHTMGDNMDYVPTRTPVLFGHHFASIAGAGPIVGPVIAAAFGWLPVLLWIIIGVIFIGSVHDFTALIASVRHRGKSIGEIIESYIGKEGKVLFGVFAWSALILVIAVFNIIIAKTFISVPSSGTSSCLFMVIAVLFGISLRRNLAGLLPLTIIGVGLIFGSVYAGVNLPIKFDDIAGALGNSYFTVTPFHIWAIVLLAYIFIASVLPVWALLQPRDYLNSFLLYSLIIAGTAGVILSGPQLSLEPFESFKTGVGYMFPVLFVTVACGAVSGFHSLIASGTTAKQLNRESDAKIIGYGGMLLEGFLAVIALIAAGVLTSSEYHGFFRNGSGPVALFSQSLGNFIHSLSIPVDSAVNFTALTVSAFALTSLDTATRLARYIFQELFEQMDRQKRWLANMYVATGITVLCSGFLTFSGTALTIWPLFGSANQLLAALALLAVSVWLGIKGIKNRFTLYPMIFMLIVTISSLAVLAYENMKKSNLLLVGLSIFLILIALFMVLHAGRVLLKRKG